ncbi:Fatty acid oxidation complex subunit alpha [Roseivivax jejudonensis]|uniref:Fatty acid oxidation complex subunit alpha n=1 Tax=Roseivivax jejudonensis TaxID=1529041 RepID=A0A1X6Z7G9_9RHOB|nr:enoyl-CoA hydratase-related protein [Roseivivax jejudonensis]SLN43101.1 Fatty acid oxidation complex subunit alpha [Roseivivax jejudonensis]
MTGLIHVSITAGVAHVALDNPPLNTLVAELRAALIAALERLSHDDTVNAVVISGRGRAFSAGLDNSDHDAPPQAPSLSALCRAVEEADKPVVVALHGTVMGGAVELALAAHYRVAQAGTRLVLPEIKLGLMPQAGATQRLPRMLGAGAALDMLLTGAPRVLQPGVPDAIVEQIVDDAPEAAAEEAARQLAAEGGPPPRTSERGDMLLGATYQAEIAERRAALDPRLPEAAGHIVEAVEAAQLLPFEAGLALEEDSYETCRMSESARALRHVFAAETRARDFGLPPGLAPPRIETVGVLGGGLLAAHVAIATLDAGLAARWGTRDPEALRQGVSRIRAHYEQQVAAGRLYEAEASARLDRLALGTSEEMSQGTDFIVRAARGQGGVPAPRDVARAQAVPGWVEGLGLRFAAPATTQPLLEVIEGPTASSAELAAARAFALALGKVPIRVMSDGLSATGRLVAALHRAADALVDAGAAPEAVDAAVREWGWPRPPFELRDATGMAELVSAPRGDGAENWSARMVEAGRTGRAEGRGFYDYGVDRAQPIPSAETAGLIDAVRPRREIAPAQIRDRILAALANEGARMIEDEMLRRPLEVDLACVLGLAFPRARGGAMMAAEIAGMFRVKRVLETFDHGDREFWDPAPLWGELVKNGLGFSALNA